MAQIGFESQQPWPHNLSHQSLGGDTVDKPSIRDLLRSGWKFEYTPGTQFVGAKYGKSGRFSICEVKAQGRFDEDEVGNLIADTLNNIRVKEE